MTPAAWSRFLIRVRRAIRAFESERADGRSSWEFTVTVERDDLDGGWVAECVDLQGCMSQGETEAEAMDNLSDAIGEWIAVRVSTQMPHDTQTTPHSHTFAVDR